MKRNVNHIVTEQVTTRIRIDIKDIIEEALLAKYPEASDVYDISLNWDRTMDGICSIEEFWIVVEAGISE